MKKILSIFNKKAKRLSFVTIITFILAIFFFMTLAPLSLYAATQKSAGEIYLNNAGDDGVQVGFIPNIGKGLIMAVIGTNVSTSTTSVLNRNDSNTATYQGGALQAITSYSNTFYDEQPASFIVWAQDQYFQIRGGMSFTAMAAQTNPNDTSVFAPGAGYNVLTPIIGLWEYSRNIVYGVYIIVLIVIAFLILLRRPLGGQEVITIANSLPSLVISIILVTFSYPICGLFIDAVYLGSNLAYNVLFTGPNSPGNGILTNPTVKYDKVGNRVTDETAELKDVIQPDDPQVSIWTILNLSGANICNRNTMLSGVTSPGGTNNAECSFSFILPKQASNMMLSGTIDLLIKGISDTPLGKAASSVLLELILALAMFQTALKLFFNLLNSYLILSIYPIISPWVFLSAAIPNNLTKTLNDFVKTLGAASLNLIVIYACFLLLIIFGNSAANSANASSGLTDSFKQAGQIQWVPPLLGYSNEQVFNANSLQNNGSNIITSLLVFGLYMAIPNISEMIKKFLEVASPFQQLVKTKDDMKGVGTKALSIVGSGAKALTDGRLFGGGKQ